MVGKIQPPVNICIEDNFCIRFGLKMVALFCKCFFYFKVVVDLAIKYNGKLPSCVGNGLVPGIKINNPQPSYPQTNIFVYKMTILVRASMYNGPEHACETLFADNPFFMEMVNPANPTHYSYFSSLS